jgi:hypothetical protein
MAEPDDRPTDVRDDGARIDELTRFTLALSQTAEREQIEDGHPLTGKLSLVVFGVRNVCEDFVE